MYDAKHAFMKHVKRERERERRERERERGERKYGESSKFLSLKILLRYWRRNRGKIGFGDPSPLLLQRSRYTWFSPIRT